jgi:hypothetical protein
MVQVIEHLSSKCKVLSSNSTVAKKKKRKEKRRKKEFEYQLVSLVYLWPGRLELS